VEYQDQEQKTNEAKQEMFASIEKARKKQEDHFALMKLQVRPGEPPVS